MEFHCLQRLALTKRVADAREAYEKALLDRDHKILLKAQKAGREAVRALKKHTDEHGCTLPQWVNSPLDT